MSKRLYFMLPDTRVCCAVVTELKTMGISHKHMHAIADIEQSLEGLPKASMLQKTEFIHGLESGLSVGGIAGLLCGLLTVSFPPAGLVLGGAAVAATTLAGAGFGAIVSALVATDIPNHEVDAFEEGIMKGQILLIVDVPRKRVEEFIEMIKAHHAVVEIGIADLS